jgi:hypothetical protein
MATRTPRPSASPRKHRLLEVEVVTNAIFEEKVLRWADCLTLWRRQQLSDTCSVLEDVLPWCDLLHIGPPTENLSALPMAPPVPLTCSQPARARVEVRGVVLGLVLARNRAGAALLRTPDAMHDVTVLAQRLLQMADSLGARGAPGGYAGMFVGDACKVLNALEFLLDGEDYRPRLAKVAKTAFWSTSARNEFISVLRAYGA